MCASPTKLVVDRLAKTSRRWPITTLIPRSFKMLYFYTFLLAWTCHRQWKLQTSIGDGVDFGLDKDIILHEISTSKDIREQEVERRQRLSTAHDSGGHESTATSNAKAAAPIETVFEVQLTRQNSNGTSKTEEWQQDDMHSIVTYQSPQPRSTNSSVFIFVLTTREAHEQRQAIRETWASGHDNIYFVLGRVSQELCEQQPPKYANTTTNSDNNSNNNNSSSASETEERESHVVEDTIQKEMEQYRDIILDTSIIDNCRTAKIKSAYSWAMHNLPQHVVWFVKVEDGMYVRTSQFINAFPANPKQFKMDPGICFKPPPIRRFKQSLPVTFDATKHSIISGRALTTDTPRRGGSMVEIADTQHVTYPPFFNGASGHVISRPLAEYISNNLHHLINFEEGEDISLGIWAKEAPMEVYFLRHRYMTTLDYIASETCDDKILERSFVIGHQFDNKSIRECFKIDQAVNTTTLAHHGNESSLDNRETNSSITIDGIKMMARNTFPSNQKLLSNYENGRYYNNFTNNIARGANIMTSKSGCAIAAWVYEYGANNRDCSPFRKGDYSSRQKVQIFNTADHFKDRIQRIQPYDTVYMNVYFVANFVKHALPQIKVPIVLLTGRYDTYQPFTFRKHIVKKILENENIVAWFSHNPDMYTGLNAYNETQEDRKLPSKLHPLAFGIQPHYYEDKSSLPSPAKVVQEALLGRHLNILPEQKTQEVYAGYLDITNPTRGTVPNGPKLPLPDYIDQIAKSKFVISPNGDHPDCYRHYEALAFGAIPITELPAGIYSHLQQGPAVYNNHDWWNLTETKILQKMNLTQFPTVNRNLIFEEYWIEEIEHTVGKQLRWHDRLAKKQVPLHQFIRKSN